ncbi:MAG: GAF and ANTAR domain-containing protein [Streptosporangiaceae bacterium]
MVQVTRALAERISQVARLLETDEDSDAALRRLTDLGVELVPGGTAVAVTVAADQQALTFAASDSRVDELHRLQVDAAQGPLVETLRHNEPRHVEDTASERRWPAFCQAAARVGFGSCLVLPLRTDRRPAGAIALYGREPNAFRGGSYDLAVLFAAQGGTALHNAALHRACLEMIRNLHTALESRAIIEQAKGILHAEYGVSPEEAFRLLSRMSRSTNRKVREIAAELVRGGIDRGQFRPAQPRRPEP